MVYSRTAARAQETELKPCKTEMVYSRHAVPSRNTEMGQLETEMSSVEPLSQVEVWLLQATLAVASGSGNL